ncbi:MAG TPA: aminotransferase class I/II-fold pyridoxal phosphate-dependent enzyme [Ktedonobacteraceae bacterium]
MEMNEFRVLGHELVDWIAEYLETVEGRLLFPVVTPRDLDELFAEPLPQDPSPPDQVFRDLKEKLVPNCCHVNHPGYFGFITSTPTPMGILADLLCSALNQNVGVYSIGPGAVALECRTVRWLADLVGYGDSAGGHLTSGGTMANFVGLKLARDWASDNRAQHEGIRNHWAIYVSEERHVSLDKAVDAIGVGRESMRKLPVDDEFRIRLDALEDAIASDRQHGIRPMCIIGLAGTTNTGAVDPLEALRQLADREQAWFHVDAAYGGGMLLSQKWPRLLQGIQLADSITIDPHKWFFAPLDAGALLVRERAQLRRSFGMQTAYLLDESDLENERFQYYIHSFEQSRRFRSLKVWMSFKRYGSKQIGQWIDANVEQAKYLALLCEQHPNFQVAAQPLMSAICIRYQPPSVDEGLLSRLHAEVARRIEDGGQFWITTTQLKGKSWFRINPVNFRTRLDHMEALLALLQRECELVHLSWAKNEQS